MGLAEPCDLARLPGLNHRHGAGHRVDDARSRRSDLAQRRRVRHARSDGVHGDDRAGHSPGHGLGEGDHTTFRGGIERFDDRTDAPGIRADVDDATPERHELVPPTLFTRMSTAPNSPSIVASPARTDTMLVTSRWTAAA